MSFQPGPQQPEKYPFVGDAYRQWGEIPGYVYWPYNDTYYIDPNAARETGEALGIVEPAPEQPGLIETLAPVAGGAAAFYAGKEVAQRGVEGLFNKGKSPATAAPEIINVSRIPSVGSNAGLAGAGATAPVDAVSGIGPVADGAAYGDALAAEASWFGGDTSWLAAGDPLAGEAAGLLPYAGAALGAYNMYDMFANPTENAPRGALSGAASGAAIGSVIPGVGTVIGAGIGALLGAGSTLTYHKSTKDYQQERWGNASKNAATEADRQAVQTFSHSPNDDGVLDEGALAGRKWKWDEIKEVASGKDLVGALAFIETFPDWISGYTHEERLQIAQAALDENLLMSEKGDIIASGKGGQRDRLKEIAGLVKAGQYQSVLSPEQREARRQAKLQELKQAEGYDSPMLGVPYFTAQQGEQPQAGQPPVATGEAPQLQQEPLTTPMEGSNAMLGQRPIQQPRNTGLGLQRSQSPQQSKGLFTLGSSAAPGLGQGQPFQSGPYAQFVPGQGMVGNQQWNDLMEQRQNMPDYFEGAPAGQYRAPDGVNTFTVRPDGSVMSTLMSTAPIDSSMQNMFSGLGGFGLLPSYSASNPALTTPQQIGIQDTAIRQGMAAMNEAQAQIPAQVAEAGAASMMPLPYVVQPQPGQQPPNLEEIRKMLAQYGMQITGGQL